MKCSRIQLACAMSAVLVACGGDGSSPGPGVVGPETTIQITSDDAPALVAFRDVVHGWQPATMTSPTTFEAVVHGTYMVTVVCDVAAADALLGKDSFETTQYGQSLADPTTLDHVCGSLPYVPRVLSGTMVQPGQVEIGQSMKMSTTPSWSFTVSPVDDSDVLYATDSTRVAIRRGLATSSTLTPAIDLDTEGAAFGAATFAVDDLVLDEQPTAIVALESSASVYATNVFYDGPVADARLLPDSAIAATEVQTVEIRANRQGSDRSMRRPFKIGDDLSFAMTAPVGALDWDVGGRHASATWSSLADGFSLSMGVTGYASDPSKAAAYSVYLSTQYVSEAAPTMVEADLDFSGFQSAWQLDAGQPYTRFLEADQFGSHTSISQSVFENTGGVSVAGPPRLRRRPQ